jgi:hypothetical protein
MEEFSYTEVDAPYVGGPQRKQGQCIPDALYSSPGPQRQVLAAGVEVDATTKERRPCTDSTGHSDSGSVQIQRRLFSWQIE